jgi:SAM-dependent methyltransferase
VDPDPRAVGVLRRRALEGRPPPVPVLVEEVGDVAGRDLLHLQCHFGGDFDVVFTSFGALNWLPDVPRRAEVIGHFVRPGGFFYIAEGHPFAWVFDDDEAATELRLRYHYWPSGGSPSPRPSGCP